MKIDPIHFSYTSTEKDEFCNRAGYYNKIFAGGQGIVPARPGWDLVYGNIIHAGVESLAKTNTIDFAAVRAHTLEEASKCFSIVPARSWAALAEGALRGFAATIWPRWMQEYKVYQSERQGIWKIDDNNFFVFRQDLVLESLFTPGKLTYVEIKTTGLNTPEWIASWARHVQIASSLYAIRQQYGIEIADCIVQGFYKGFKDKKAGMQKSIFNQGWTNNEYSMYPDYSYTYQRGRGWEPFSTFEEFADLEEWVAKMPREVLAQQYPQTAPMPPRDDIAQKFFRQQLIRNREVAEAQAKLSSSTSLEEVQLILDTHFKQDFSRCKPAMGISCDFEQICWENWVEADPLGSRLFVVKSKPDHQEVI